MKTYAAQPSSMRLWSFRGNSLNYGGAVLFTKSVKTKWALFLFVLAGIFIGGLIGDYLGNMPYLGWLKIGTSFGIDPPFVLDLEVLKLSVGIIINFNIASLIGIAVSLFIFKKI